MTRYERIEKAIAVLNSEKSKAIFKDLAAKNNEFSVFWEKECSEASLEGDDITITIQSDGQ